ncbi:MAG: MBL fold metallo-hydrolase [Clostridia bacterium]|nr:MBL fold metallo-hydrolase [Clostridia bacterium]
MKLTFLMDNNVKWGLEKMVAQHGFSVFIEESGKRILFDTGYTGIFLENAKALGVDLTDLDYVVLSHSHNDHTGGLPALMALLKEAPRNFAGLGEAAGTVKKPVLVYHPDAAKRHRDAEGDFGMPVTEEELAEVFTIHKTREPFWLTENLCYLGEIPRTHAFENVPTFGERLEGDTWVTEDFIDDSALAYRGPEGAVVISGCGHSGICNISSYALAVTGEEKLFDIVGGLHTLNEKDNKFRGTLDFVAGFKPKKLHPCHCTAFCCRSAFRQIAEVEELGAGSVLEFA